MAQPLPLQTAFLGMVRDYARDQLPGGALWNCVDYIPEYLGAPLRKRGGWAYASNALGASTYVDALVYAPFAAAEKTFAIGSDHHVYSIAPGSAADVGTAFAVAQNPVYHRSGSPTVGTVIIPASSGTTTPKSYDGTTFQDLAGTPPQAKYAAVWNDRCLLANGTVGGTLLPNRVWFGPIGNSAGTWDTTNSWLDGSFPITGIGVLKTAIMVFHQRTTERLRGSTPTTAAAIGDLALDVAFSVGCIDARSIVNYNDTLLWADARGIYQSDGATLRDLTSLAGMRTYWRSMLASYSSSYTVAAGVFSDTYIVSVMNGRTVVDCLAFDLARGFCYRLSNFGSRCFARQGSLFEEVYMGRGTEGRVVSLSSILSPTSANKNDADGTAITPVIETGMFRGWFLIRRHWTPSLALQQWKELYFDYLMTDADTDAPTLTISFSSDPASSTYTDISRLLSATTKSVRVRRDLGQHTSGLMFKIAQANASADTRIFGLEGNYSPLEPGRLAQ